MGLVHVAMSLTTEFQSLIPPLTEAEYAQLEESIVSEGCRDALVVWDNTIIDGHNRYAICSKHGIEFETICREFEGKEAAKIWIIRNQLARRNLNTYQRSVLALQLEPLIAAKAKENQLSGLKQYQAGTVCQKSDKREVIDTKRELAKTANVSHDTIAKTKKIEQEATDEQKEELKQGKSSINQVYQQVKTKDRRSKRIKSIKWLAKKLIQDLSEIGKRIPYTELEFERVASD